MNIDSSAPLYSLWAGETKDINLKQLTKDEAALKEKTDEFESIMIRTILDTSLKMESHLFPKEAGEDIYNFMYKDALSKSLSGSFGYSQLLFEFLSEQQKGKTSGAAG